jgi:hypothetical protein
MNFNDNVWYLPNLIDIRTCPKNGMTSVKNFYYKLMSQITNENYSKYNREFKTERGGPINFREYQVWNYCDFTDIPFRKYSTRFAVKRDPVKRFLSAVEYLQANFDKEGKRTIHKRTYPKKYEDLDELLTDIETQKMMNIHFFPQSYYMGNVNKYQFVYRLSDLDKMFEHLCSLYEVPKFTMKLNKTQRTITKDISMVQIGRIRKLYQIDYENGWY